jgi:hypothetical protein
VSATSKRAAWVEDYCRKTGRKHPPISGLDIPGDYDGPEWVPTSKWTFSACEAGVDHLNRLGRDRPDLHKRCADAWEDLSRKYEWLDEVRRRAVAHAQRQIRGGHYPRKPPSLFGAQERERDAFTRVCRLMELYHEAT